MREALMRRPGPGSYGFGTQAGALAKMVHHGGAGAPFRLDVRLSLFAVDYLHLGSRRTRVCKPLSNMEPGELPVNDGSFLERFLEMQRAQQAAEGKPAAAERGGEQDAAPPPPPPPPASQPSSAEPAGSGEQQPDADAAADAGAGAAAGDAGAAQPPEEAEATATAAVAAPGQQGSKLAPAVLLKAKRPIVQVRTRSGEPVQAGSKRKKGGCWRRPGVGGRALPWPPPLLACCPTSPRLSQHALHTGSLALSVWALVPAPFSARPRARVLEIVALLTGPQPRLAAAAVSVCRGGWQGGAQVLLSQGEACRLRACRRLLGCCGRRPAGSGGDSRGPPACAGRRDVHRRAPGITKEAMHGPHLLLLV